MQHQVPQFIDVEDKIFGPLTAKQFFYVAAGGSIIFIMYVFFQMWLVILIGVPVAAFSLALAFLKLNGIPFIKIVSNALSYASSNRLFLWKKVPKAVKTEKINPKQIRNPKFSNSKHLKYLNLEFVVCLELILNKPQILNSNISNVL